MSDKVLEAEGKRIKDLEACLLEIKKRLSDSVTDVLTLRVAMGMIIGIDPNNMELIDGVLGNIFKSQGKHPTNKARCTVIALSVLKDTFRYEGYAKACLEPDEKIDADISGTEGISNEVGGVEGVDFSMGLKIEVPEVEK